MLESLLLGLTVRTAEKVLNEVPCAALNDYIGQGHLSRQRLVEKVGADHPAITLLDRDLARLKIIAFCVHELGKIPILTLQEATAIARASGIPGFVLDTTPGASEPVRPL